MTRPLFLAITGSAALASMSSPAAMASDRCGQEQENVTTLWSEELNGTITLKTQLSWPEGEGSPIASGVARLPNGVTVELPSGSKLFDEGPLPSCEVHLADYEAPIMLSLLSGATIYDVEADLREAAADRPERLDAIGRAARSDWIFRTKESAYVFGTYGLDVRTGVLTLLYLEGC